MKMGGQFAPEKGWSVCAGKQPKSDLFRGGQFDPESGGQFERILQIKHEFNLLTARNLIKYLKSFFNQSFIGRSLNRGKLS
jgi:hypothetical protein